MSIELQNIPLPAQTRSGATSKYDFANLSVGGPAIVENEVINASKVASRMQSAVVAYRKRTGDKSKFSVRIFNAADGAQRVGVWKVADAPVAA